MKRYRALIAAIYRLYEHSGFSMAGAVAFSFVVSLFPFCIFLGALSGIVGSRELAEQAVNQLLEILPAQVVAGLAPEVVAIMSRSRIDLLTVSGGIALFFATSAVETLRAALNGAYRVQETRSYPFCLLLSTSLVFLSAISMLVLTWAVLVGPTIASQIDPNWKDHLWGTTLFDQSWFAAALRYSLAGAVITVQLFAYHLWLAAGKRRIRDVWPGIALTVLLWLVIASLYSYYLAFGDWTRFYAGLSQLMVALIFFQFTAIVIILGAELNRGILELKKIGNGQPSDS